MKKLTILMAGVALGVVAPAAVAAPPEPFGHACSPQNGTLFCPTTSDAERVPSFDGVPLDVDVTLPPTGDGPFPAIVMLHGWGGSKSAFQSPTPEGDGGTGYHYNNTYFAQQGYAVITPSARGFGRSCGVAGSRTPGACDRGWLHLADQRYEVRDVQQLLGRLVDEGVVRADALGVTGISYGGIQSHSLARLRDRIRLQNGSYRRWRSPAGRRLRIAAAWARWGATDLTYALAPNGRFLDTRRAPSSQSRSPLGIYKKTYTEGLFLLGDLNGNIAPAGGPFGSDLRGWKALYEDGEPYGAASLRVARELTGLPQLGRLVRHARAAARAERLDRRPVSRTGGAAGLPRIRERFAARAPPTSSATSATRAAPTSRRSTGSSTTGERPSSPLI